MSSAILPKMESNDDSGNSKLHSYNVVLKGAVMIIMYACLPDQDQALLITWHSIKPGRTMQK